jgi:hypothetical protein
MTEYTIVEDEDVVEDVKRQAKAPNIGYLDALAEGKMLLMASVPKLGGGIKKRTGKFARLHSHPAPDGGFYVWVEFVDEPRHKGNNIRADNT